MIRAYTGLYTGLYGSCTGFDGFIRVYTGLGFGLRVHQVRPSLEPVLDRVHSDPGVGVSINRAGFADGEVLTSPSSPEAPECTEEDGHARAGVGVLARVGVSASPRPGEGMVMASEG